MDAYPDFTMNEDTVRKMARTNRSLTRTVLHSLDTFLTGGGDGGHNVRIIEKGRGDHFITLIEYTIDTVVLYIKIWPQITNSPEITDYQNDIDTDLEIVMRDANFISRMDFYDGETKIYNEVITTLSKHSPNFVRSIASGSTASSALPNILARYSQEHGIPEDRMGRLFFIASVSPISEEGVERVIDLKQLCTELKEPESVNSTLKQLFMSLVLMRRMGLVHGDLHFENILVAIHSDDQKYTFKVEDEKDMYFEVESKYIIKIFDWDRSIKLEGGGNLNYPGYKMMEENFFVPDMDSTRSFDFVTIMCYLASKCGWLRDIASTYLTNLERKYGPRGTRLSIPLRDEAKFKKYFGQFIKGKSGNYVVYNLTIHTLRILESMNVIKRGTVSSEGLDKYKSILFTLQGRVLVMTRLFDCRLPFERIDYTPSLDALRNMEQGRMRRFPQFTIPRTF